VAREAASIGATEGTVRTTKDNVPMNASNQRAWYLRLQPGAIRSGTPLTGSLRILLP
jgi:hypothetical protein